MHNFEIGNQLMVVLDDSTNSKICEVMTLETIDRDLMYARRKDLTLCGFYVYDVYHFRVVNISKTLNPEDRSLVELALIAKETSLVAEQKRLNQAFEYLNELIAFIPKI